MSLAGVCPELPIGGFSFENYQRNEMLCAKGFPLPKVTKTGTTIAGIVFGDGVILGADTRATSDTIIADKNCEKIHYLAANMYCCGAGTAADTEMVTRMISSQLELHRLNTGNTVPVVAANRLLKQYLFRYQGHIGAALVLGGVDNSGPNSTPFTRTGRPIRCRTSLWVRDLWPQWLCLRRVGDQTSP
jgi:20S proteasome subunit beta 2